MHQTSIVRKSLYHINNIDETNYSSIVWQRKQKLDKISVLLKEDCSEDVALQTLEVSRASYYRWKKSYAQFGLEGLENASKAPIRKRNPSWSNSVEQRIYHLRKQFPLWGKAKIAVKYRSDFKENISESTVGRIIKKLVSQSKVMPVRFMYGRKDVKRRVFNSHAQRWRYGMKAKQPGELIQVDHMTVEMPGFGYVKHFNAVCPTTKYAVYQVYKEATSKNAADFLEHMKKSFPFPLVSIQVDGGSEFMGDFEKATFDAHIPLYVLPPRSPKFNSHVERSNATAKYEFYKQYEGAQNMHLLRKSLQKFAHFYNSVRPHQGINLLTPQRFYEKLNTEALKSHMC